MSGEPSDLEKSVEEFLSKLMANIPVSKGIQVSLTRGLQDSPSIGRRATRINPVTEQRSKHRSDLANAKQIPSILCEYIFPLDDVVNHGSIPHDFEYSVFTTYIPKGICIVGSHLGQIPLLKHNDFNLGNRKNYATLAPHRYLMKTTGKKPHLIPQPWIKGLAQSTVLNVMKILHFGCHQEVNACVKLLLSCYHGGYIWVDRRINMDPMLIYQITGLNLKGPDPQQFYPRKTSDRYLTQCIKEAYGEVEKGKRGYKIASIQDGAIHLACQLLADNLVRNNCPTQVTGFVVDLAGKCVEGLQMNSENYLVNELEKDCREAQDLGYEFHYSWWIILIEFVARKMPEGATFP
jgi:hypothetical protein